MPSGTGHGMHTLLWLCNLACLARVVEMSLRRDAAAFESDLGRVYRHTAVYITRSITQGRQYETDGAHLVA